MIESLLAYGSLCTLQAALKLSWRSSTKLLIHFSDAPAHGTMYHNGQSGDSHPGGDPTGMYTPIAWSFVMLLPVFCFWLQDSDKRILAVL